MQESTLIRVVAVNGSLDFDELVACRL